MQKVKLKEAKLKSDNAPALFTDKNIIMDKKYYLEKFQRRQRQKEVEYEPVMFVGFDKDMQNGETNYLKVIFKIDQINQFRKQKKLED